MSPRVTLTLLALLLCPRLVTGQPTYTNPVLPGDHPDPSVIRVGGDYWATATTSQWAPIFPLLHSRDLVDWEQVGAVFDTPPAWSSGSYWAPEIAHHGRRFFVYYTARKKGGPLCVAVATASQPDGPYQDRGPLVCQEVGSIDAVPVTDQRGRRYLVWKEDGNSRKQPTILWAQRLSPDGTALIGTRHEILRNEARWEAHLIEGPFIRRRGDWFYLFYSADGCCGRTCNYKLGVARARALLGPWERDPANPILEGNHDWKCPGHGSIVTTPDGRDYLLYHAYDPDAFQFVGRQGLLDAVTWGADGWPAINAGNGPSDRAVAPLGISPRERSREFLDELTGPALQLGWQWPWDHTPSRRFVAGTLALRTSTRSTGSAVDTIIARSTRSGNYTATARLVESRASDDGMAGLAAYGDAENAIGISRIGSNVVVWIREKGAQRSLASAAIGDGPSLELRIIATRGRRFQFAYSTNGREWHALGEEAEGGYLPPWDRAVRIALAVGGPPAVDARFDWLRIETR